MIRAATHADIPCIVAMGAEFIEEVYPAAMQFNGEALATLTASLIGGAGAVFVSDDEGEGVDGMIALVLVVQPMSGETIATELVWWMSPEARGGREAFRLLAIAEDWAREQGATRLQMIAPSDKVCVFYERLGFQRVEVAYMRSL